MALGRALWRCPRGRKAIAAWPGHTRRGRRARRCAAAARAVSPRLLLSSPPPPAHRSSFAALTTCALALALAGAATRTATSLQLDHAGHIYELDTVFGCACHTRGLPPPHDGCLACATALARVALSSHARPLLLVSLQWTETLIRAKCMWTSYSHACAMQMMGCWSQRFQGSL